MGREGTDHQSNPRMGRASGPKAIPSTAKGIGSRYSLPSVNATPLGVAAIGPAGRAWSGGVSAVIGSISPSEHILPNVFYITLLGSVIIASR